VTHQHVVRFKGCDLRDKPSERPAVEIVVDQFDAVARIHQRPAM